MSKKNYFIKSNYRINKNPNYYNDSDTANIWQQSIYDFVLFIAKKFHLKYIIDIGAGNGIKLNTFLSEFKITAIDYGKNISLLKSNLKGHRVIINNLENGVSKITNFKASETAVICADVIEHIKEPHKLLKDLSKFSHSCPLVIISTPDRARCWGKDHLGTPPNPSHVREWTVDEMRNLLNYYKFNSWIIGHAKEINYDNKYNTLVAVSGTLLKYPNKLIYSALKLSEIETDNMSVLGNLIEVYKKFNLGNKCRKFLNKLSK